MAETSSFELLWWWVWTLLPLPLLIRWWLPKVADIRAMRVTFLPQINRAQPTRSGIKIALATGIWLVLLTALSRPVWYGDPIEFQPQHRDLMLLVDLSGSMAQEDMLVDGDYIDRLSAVKNVVSDFATERRGDRLGLIVFADHAYLQTPLTYDRTSVVAQLQRMVIGLVGQQTAIGDGIGLATKSFIDSDAPQRVMILLSDGSNTAGTLSPQDAARIAAKYHAKLYTIGIGAGELKVNRFMFSQTVNTARDLDESTLTQIAQQTGGQYFRARNVADLKQIYQAINELEPISEQTLVWRPQSEWFHYPLGIALILSVVLYFYRRLNG